MSLVATGNGGVKYQNVDLGVGSQGEEKGNYELEKGSWSRNRCGSLAQSQEVPSWQKQDN
jgi:hypothetical protein